MRLAVSLASLVGLMMSTVAAVDATRTGVDDDGRRERDHGGQHVSAAAGAADPDQIEAIEAAVAKYQDVGVARDEGWNQELPDDPGTGAHFALSVDAEALDLAHPDYLMYTRIGRPDWELVAVAYVVDQAEFPEPPTELRGAEYHEHVWNCVAEGEELDEEDVGVLTRDDCRALDGEWDPGGVWMTHVWLIDNPDGLFAETNPDIVEQP